jgi:hypothetical protein
MVRAVFLPIEIKARRINRHIKRRVMKEIPILARYVFVGFEPGRRTVRRCVASHW